MELLGRFKPWSIDVGHSKFLLRGIHGDPESEDAPRVFDILFQDVYRISVPDVIVGVRIAEASFDLRESEEAETCGNWRRSRMFLLGGNSNRDYVVAGSLLWAEVSVHPGEVSPLLSESPRADSILGEVVRIR